MSDFLNQTEYAQYIGEGEFLLPPDDIHFVYNGRVDFDDKKAPVFSYAGSFVKFRLKASSVKLLIDNRHAYFENYIGVHAGSKSLKYHVDDGINVVDLAAMVTDEPLDYMIYKRQDASHFYAFLGLIVPKDAMLYDSAPLPLKRMEFFGDSVTCGEVCEVIERCGEDDPAGHDGIYSDSYYSYSWMTARKLGACAHLTAQGGISLLDKEGWYYKPDSYGMLTCYDKMEYNPFIVPFKEWDFSRFTPHVVVVAIGQNDSTPFDYMAEDYDGEHSKYWREQYGLFLATLRKRYKDALIITATTILGHHPNWDRAISEVTESMGDDKMHYFKYSHTGCGTKGHIRIPEADLMSDELADYIRSFGEEIWR